MIKCRRRKKKEKPKQMCVEVPGVMEGGQSERGLLRM